MQGEYSLIRYHEYVEVFYRFILLNPDEELISDQQEAEGLSWLYRLCRSAADRAILAGRGIYPNTRVHHVSELEGV